MKFWTYVETLDWLSALRGDPDGPAKNRSATADFDFVPDVRQAQSIDIPQQSWAQADLSRKVIAELGSFMGCVFALTEWGVWSQYDNRVIIDRIRLSYGESRSLDGASTFVFDEREEEEAVALLRLFMAFCYDGYLITPAGQVVLYLIGHENIGFLYTSNERKI